MERDAAREALVRQVITELVSLAAFAVVFTVMTKGDTLRLTARTLWHRRPGAPRPVAEHEIADFRRDVHDISRGDCRES